MVFIEKIVEWIVWICIIGGIIGFLIGILELIDLLLLRSQNG
jgi:hypothetical protein